LAIDDNVVDALQQLWANDVPSKVSIFGWRLLLSSRGGPEGGVRCPSALGLQLLGASKKNYVVIGLLKKKIIQKNKYKYLNFF
jgi:hypothetical protein